MASRTRKPKTSFVPFRCAIGLPVTTAWWTLKQQAYSKPSFPLSLIRILAQALCNPTMHLLRISNNAQRLGLLQSLLIVRPVGHSESVHLRTMRHFYVVRGIANHQRLIWAEIQLPHQLMQHLWIRLTTCFLGTASRIKKSAQTADLQCTHQTLAAFTCGHTEQHPLPFQLVKEFSHAFKQLQIVITLEIMMTIARHKLRQALLIQLGENLVEPVFNGQAYNPAGLFPTRHWQAHILARQLYGAGDGIRGIHHGAIPIKNHCSVFFHLSSVI